VVTGQLSIGPVEFITYAESVVSVFDRHNISHQLFADDKQAYAGVDDVRGRLRDCTTDISNWCASRQLHLNVRTTRTRQSLLGSVSALV